MQIVVFEDEHVWRLHPISIGRAAYAIGCGSFRLVDWLERLAHETGAALHGIVRPHLEQIQKLDFPELSNQPLENHAPMLVVNARLVPSVAVYRGLGRLIKRGETAAVVENRSLAAAMIANGGPMAPPDHQQEHWIKYVTHSIVHKLPTADMHLRSGCPDSRR